MKSDVVDEYLITKLSHPYSSILHDWLYSSCHNIPSQTVLQSHAPDGYKVSTIYWYIRLHYEFYNDVHQSLFLIESGYNLNLGQLHSSLPEHLQHWESLRFDFFQVLLLKELLVWEWQHGAGINRLALDEDCAHLFTASRDSTIKRYLEFQDSISVLSRYIAQHISDPWCIAHLLLDHLWFQVPTSDVYGEDFLTVRWKSCRCICWGWTAIPYRRKWRSDVHKLSRMSVCLYVYR